MLEKFTYDGKKETPPPEKVSANICKIAQIFVTSLHLVDVLSVYVKKWIIVFILNKLILIYFTWFVHTFVNYKYNVLLERQCMFNTT